ncbi:MAG: TetR family transcriptional regulator [Actinomycetota bacterium]
MTAEASTVEESSTVDRIVDAVLAVLARDGMAGVSMRAVAREAEVAVGLAHYHFDSKTALVAAALQRVGEADVELVSPADGLSAPDQLREHLERAFDPSFLAPTYLSLRLQLWSLAGVDPQFAAINRAAQQRYLNGLSALVGAVRPDLGRDEVARRAADILIVQNGVWLTAVLVPDDEAVARAIARCEQITFD